jgi:hypothetical protein
MFTKKIFTFFVIALFSTIFAASEINAQKSFFVDGKQPSVDTGDRVNVGDLVEVIDISGEFKYSPTLTASYKGDENVARASKDFTYPNAAKLSLVGYIGDKKDHFQVEKNLGFVAGTSGNLFFGLNDTVGSFANNSGGYTVKYKITKNSPNRFVSFQSVNNKNMYLLHKDALGGISSTLSSNRKEATFKIVPGLTGAPNTVSIESVDKPGYFLRHEQFKVFFHSMPGPGGVEGFKKDATFKIVPGLSGKGNSYESVNFPGNYIRHCSYELFLDNNKRNNKACNIEDNVYLDDTSFVTVDGLGK